MPELNGRELLDEWRRLMDAVLAPAGGRAELPRNLVRTMQRQIELAQEVIERERRLQRQLAGSIVAPVDAVFDLLEESGAALRRQAEALESAGRALEEAAGLMKLQAGLFERTIGALRQPTEFAKAAAGLERRAKQSAPRKAAQSAHGKAAKSAPRKAAKSTARRPRESAARKPRNTAAGKSRGDRAQGS